MANERIYFATQQVAFAPELSTTYTRLKGGQTITVNENFPTQEIFQLGRLEVYEQLEDLPDIEVTVTKVLDGCPPAFLLATTTATTPTLVERCNQQCKVALSIFNISQEEATGTPLTVAEISGCDVTSLSYTFGNDGAFEESCGFIANDIVVSNDTTIVNPAVITRRDAISVPGQFTGDNDPCSQVNQRQHFIFAYDAGAGVDAYGRVADPDASCLPTDINGVTSSGTNPVSGDGYAASIESITVSANLSREELNSLGTWAPTARFLQTPVEVTTEIRYRAYNIPLSSATKEGILATGNDQCDTAGGNTQDQSIRLVTCEGLRIYLGRKNRINSVNYGGGDTTGGSVTVSRTYRTFNDFTVMHSADTAGDAATWWTSRSTYLTG